MVGNMEEQDERTMRFEKLTAMEQFLYAEALTLQRAALMMNQVRDMVVSAVSNVEALAEQNGLDIQEIAKKIEGEPPTDVEAEDVAGEEE